MRSRSGSRAPIGWAIAVLVAAVVAGCGGEPEESPTTTTGAGPATEPDLGTVKTPARPDELIDDSSVRAFEAFAQDLDGEVGLTVGVPGSPRSQQLGSLESGAAWSTIKVPIAARVLEEAGGPDGLTAAQSESIRGAITESDNAAADTLFASLGANDQSAAASTAKVLREAGDTRTDVSAQGRDGFSPYGQTEWPLADQHRFMARLAGGCVIDAESSDHLLSLMGEVVPDQRWGLGTAGESATFKGGWGPGVDGGYLVRQMGVVEVAGGAVVVTLAAEPSDGQFASGTAILTELAGWVDENVKAEAAKPVGC